MTLESAFEPALDDVDPADAQARAAPNATTETRARTDRFIDYGRGGFLSIARVAPAAGKLGALLPATDGGNA